jgi:hypothetical protein
MTKGGIRSEERTPPRPRRSGGAMVARILRYGMTRAPPVSVSAGSQTERASGGKSGGETAS